MENTVKTQNSQSFLQRLSKPVDLTKGKPWKVILLYAAPIMLSYFLQQIYTLTDAIICGQVLSAQEVAGVNDTFALTFIFLQFAFGCTAGFSVITANYVGCKNAKGVRRSFAIQIYLSVAISIFLTVLSLLLLPTMLKIINVTRDHKEVYDAAYIYCFIIFIGIIAQMGYNFICGILRAYGDSVTPLIFLVVSTVLNVALDLIFLVPLHMGPAGAAAATVLTQLLSVIICFAYTFAKYKELRLHREDWKVSLSSIGLHLKQGIPLGLQFSILAVGIIIMQGAVVKFDITSAGAMVAGTPAQNGFGAANKLINFLMVFFNGLGAGILGYNAQNYGKGAFERIKKGTVQSYAIMLVIYFACLVCGLLLCINGAYQHIFMSADKITAESVRFGNSYLFVDISLYIVLGFLIVTRSAVQGICKPGFVLGAGIAELVTRSAICAFLPSIINKAAITSEATGLSFVSLCFGDPGAWCAASLVLLVPTIKYILHIKSEDEHRKLHFPQSELKK